MESTFFVKGLIAGFIICIPFGPIGLLCVMRTLTDGKLAGIASVLGASVMDAVYCAVAGLGVSYISSFLNKESMVLRLAGGLILIAMGSRSFSPIPLKKSPRQRAMDSSPLLVHPFFLC